MDPAGLGERGVSLWSDLSTGDSVVDALALEIARTADRLDELDSIIQGKGVLNLMQFRLTELHLDGDEPVSVEVKFNAVMQEAKGQQSALTSLLSKYEATVKSRGVSKRGTAGRPVEDLPDNVSPLSRMLAGGKRA